MKYNLNNLSHIDEFTYFYKNHLLPLLGIAYEKPILSKRKNNNKLINIQNQELCFFENETSDNCYIIKVSKNFPKNSLSILRCVYKEINMIRYKKHDDSVKNVYYSFQHLQSNYFTAVQKGISEWFSGSIDTNNILCLLDQLEKWSLKTYEGKKMSFAFVINNEKNGSFDYMDFFQEEYSATFSDGITSIIELDSNLNFYEFHSLTSLENCDYTIKNAPYRFSQVINNFTDKKIAVFLLSNGDIILIKNKEIELVKREGKWLNFNKSVFIDFICTEFNDESDDFKRILLEIYLSCLDVSFAHAGGIIACILPNKINDLVESNIYEKIIKKEIDADSFEHDNQIIHFLDNFKIPILSYNILCKSFPNIFKNNEMKKRFIKRDFLLNICKNKKFYDIDRNLRCELLSMDGATIIDKNADIISIGAIIQNKSGSYGGGRGAAARRLSNYGFAIKISTDGYIELYIKDRLKYKIK